MLQRYVPAPDDIAAALTELPASERVSHLLTLLQQAPPGIFWPAFLECFPACENTRRFNRQILLRLRQAGSALPYLAAAVQHGLAAREHYILVYRGCQSIADARRALAWTFSYGEADAYARWHQANGRRSSVYTALIPRTKIFAAYDDKKGKTVLLDYEFLGRVQRSEDAPQEDRPLDGRFDLGFGCPLNSNDAERRDDNDDGKTAEFRFGAEQEGAQGFSIKSFFAPITPKFARDLPPIENMSDPNLAAMLKLEQMKLEQGRTAPAEVAIIKKHIRRALAEIQARKDGAEPGRGADGEQEHRGWGAASIGKSPGRPTNASKVVTLPTRKLPPSSTDSQG